MATQRLPRRGTVRRRKRLGKRILEAMYSAGLNQTELAAKSGCAPCNISLLASGVHSPSVWMLQSLSVALGVSMDWLMS